MNLILDTNEEKIYATTLPYAEGCQVTKKVIIKDLGYHAIHKFMETDDDIIPQWEVSNIIETDTRDGISTEVEAEFLYRAKEYQDDNYSPLRTLLKQKNYAQTHEERRAIFYDKVGNIVQDTVYVVSLDNPITGIVSYDLNPDSGEYENAQGDVYIGPISNAGTFERINIIKEEAQKLLTGGLKY